MPGIMAGHRVSTTLGVRDGAGEDFNPAAMLGGDAGRGDPPRAPRAARTERDWEGFARADRPASSAVGGQTVEGILGLLRDPSVSVERRIRRIASPGAIGAVLLGASAFDDMPDADLEVALRNVAHDVLGGSSSDD